jgi:hypothetical protein
MTGSGVSRRPERFGGSVVDDERDALRRTLEAFEARVREDTFDSEPGSAKKAELEAALERMRDETKELERLRGAWHERGLPGVYRDWNDVPEATTATPPLADARYAAYVEARKERENLLNGGA